MLKTTAGATLRHARWAKRLSIRELSKIAEVSTATIVKLERNEEISRGEIIYALADALDLDPSLLFEEVVA